ncbi:uncharacterized protein ACA1_086290 [Acanthamoeba castellanii str. Neff]|uniref:Uncharacterized protein n=1 Tax=Acanthamoeba castellanii (strain ATCC 30010 / Neff) TaxID=1257118 RepID=L8HI75_ACACF|nr:uncharacterized protein ACA1_086290 [Acanthamoeba castellanii str. Neff]ELR24398.1 hypothetical protein ACA1_086290 [Acanthamoeba castellanii str. Neff]
MKREEYRQCGLGAVALTALVLLVIFPADASSSSLFFGVEFAYSVHLSFDSFTAVSAKEQKMKTVTAESGSGDVLWNAQVYDCTTKRAYAWTAFTNNTLGRCATADIASICPIATGPTFWGSFAFLQNTSLLEFDDVQQWRWQGPYTWQKGDFYTRTVVGGRIEPVAIAAMATSIGASGKAAPSTTTWNYYTSFTNELPFDAFAIPAACFASSPLPTAAAQHVEAYSCTRSALPRMSGCGHGISKDCSGTPLMTITYEEERCYQSFNINSTVCQRFFDCAGNGRIDQAVLYGRCAQYLLPRNASLLVQSDGVVRSYLSSPDCTKGFIPFTPPKTNCEVRKASASCSELYGSASSTTSAGSASPASALHFWLRQLLSLL